MIEAKFKEYIESITKINDAFWDDLERSSSISIFKKGEEYAKMGEPVKRIGFLVSGIIRIYFLEDDGSEWNKAFLESNSFLLSNINYEEKSQVYFEALTDCEIRIAPISFFVDGLNRYPNLQKIYQHEVGKLFKRKSERELNLLKLTARDRYLKFTESHSTILDQIPQYHIASYLGITPTQLSRIKISLQNQQM